MTERLWSGLVRVTEREVGEVRAATDIPKGCIPVRAWKEAAERAGAPKNPGLVERWAGVSDPEPNA
jgi:hypothetical protein